MGTATFSVRPLALDTPRLNDVLARFYSKRGVKVIKEIRKAFALSGSEFARLFGVSPEAVRKWERDGVPPARLPDLFECRDLIAQMKRHYETARLPAVIRMPIAKANDRTLLQIIGEEGLMSALDILQKNPPLSHMAVLGLASSIALLRKERKVLEEFGVRHAALFGSVARGDACSDSDVDILVDLDPRVRIGLVQFVDLQERLRELFQRNVDVISKRALDSERDAEIFEEAVYAF